MPGYFDQPLLSKQVAQHGVADEAGHFMINPAAAATSFDARLSEFIQTGVLNGTFSRGPSDTSANIDESNSLPDWTGPVAVAGGAITARWLADATAPSGYVIRMEIIEGSASDEIYFEQVIPIVGAYDQLLNAALEGSFVNSGTNTFNYTLAIDWLAADAVTLANTGTSASGTLASGATLHRTIVGPQPATNAAYARIRWGMKRGAAATTNTGSIDFYGIRLERQLGRLRVGDDASPATGYDFSLYGSSGNLYVSGGANGITRLSSTAGTKGVLEQPEQTAPNTPASTYVRVYVDNLGNARLHTLDDAGHDTILAGASWQAFAYAAGLTHASTTTGGINLDVVGGGLGGAKAIPVLLHNPMLLQQLTIWNTDTASARTAEWSLYVDSGDATFDLVTGATGTFSFTPGGAASLRSSAAASAPVFLSPGTYWLVIRNTSGAQTFGLGLVAAGTMVVNASRTNTGIAALGSTIDISAWTAATSQILARLDGRIGAEAAAF